MEVSLQAVVDIGSHLGPPVLATDGAYLAFRAGSGSSVQVLDLGDLQRAPLHVASGDANDLDIHALAVGEACIGTSDPQHHSRFDFEPVLLVATDLLVTAWRLRSAFTAAAVDALSDNAAPMLQPPLTVLAGAGRVTALALCGVTNHAAVCAATGIVHVVHMRNAQHIWRLQAHRAAALAACFCAPHRPNWLVTAGEDRTFAVWDLEQGALLYQSAVLTAAPLVVAALDPGGFRVALGAADGVLRFFDLETAPACRCLQVVDVAQQVGRAREAAQALLGARAAAASQPAGPHTVPRARQPGGIPVPLPVAAEPSTETVLCGDGLVSLCFMPRGRAHISERLAGLLGDTAKLLVGTMRGLGVLDAGSYQLTQYYAFRGSGFSTGDLGQSGIRPPGLEHLSLHGLPAVDVAAGMVSSASPCAGGRVSVVCCAASATRPELSLMAVSACGPAQGDLGCAITCEDSRHLTPGMSEGVVPEPAGLSGPGPSVFMMRPLPPGSPLLLSGVNKGPQGGGGGDSGRRASEGDVRARTGQTTAATRRCPNGASRSLIQDKPLTFHKQIKSSGYGFVQPPVKLGRAPPRPIKLDPRPAAPNLVSRQLLAAKQYPCDAGAPTVAAVDEVLPGGRTAHAGAVMCLQYSGDGSRLLSCSADKSARVMKLPLSRHQGEGTDLIGHNGAVLWGAWSQDGTLLLTSSSDRTARMWVAGSAQPALVFNHVKRAAGGGPRQPRGGAGLPPSSNPPFLADLPFVGFFNLDRIVMLACGSKMHLYSYSIAPADPLDDIARLKHVGSYTHLASHAAAAQGITAAAAVNVFPSPLALLATSARSIEVLDCGAMTVVAQIPDAHARAVHTVVQAAGASMFTSHPRDAQELFATAATDGLLRLWDVRSCGCVRAFSGHKNSQMRVGAAFSPCLRYLAVGSEDGAAHVYDVRQGTHLARLRDHPHPAGGAVTDVAFHPLTPQLVAGTLAGGLGFYQAP